MTAKTWSDYADFKETNPQVTAYYGAVHRCTSLALTSLTPSKVREALDIACGYGDSTRLLTSFANRIDGVDCSANLIEIAQQRFAGDDMQFYCCSFDDFTTTRRYDLAAAFWFLNHLHSVEDLKAAAEKIHQLVVPGGAVCFVVPSDAFTSRRTQAMALELGWRQAWFDEQLGSTNGVFNYSGDEFIPTTIWQPMMILRVFRPWMQLSCWDVKATLADEELLLELNSEPPFEILYGRTRGSGEAKNARK